MTTAFSQIAPRDALDTIFASSARSIVLRLFMLDPRRAYYQRQLEQATGLPIRAVQRELDRLTSIDLLYRRMEGKRAYYQVDMQFPLFPELRSMVLKAGDALDQLRADLALDESVRLAFYREGDRRVLVVTSPGMETVIETTAKFEFEVMSSEDFLRALVENRSSLDPYLREGVDLLGRRDDVIWHRIENAGFEVQKGKGIP